MRIAIQASDLDSKRIDGTRVYLLNMLNRFGKISPNDDFFVFHKNGFNPELEPKNHSNYKIISKNFPFYWTQIRFAMEIWKGKYDALWMPMQALPFVRRKNLKTTVTIHDLAFKIFPQFFPKKDLRRLNLFTDFAVKKSDKIIAVSHSTKNDILKFYPMIKEEKIKVIYHGFDPKLLQEKISDEEKNKINTKYKILNTKYILYVGAIQPRKNLKELIKAFEIIKKERKDLKLVLAGGKAWMWEEVMERISRSTYHNDIIVTGTIPFSEVISLYKNASVFVFPSLYEGFGIPVLEAFACGVPVILAKNSSLLEVGGGAANYFESIENLCYQIREILDKEELRKEMIEKGFNQAKKFSWDKCAEETIELIKS